MTAKILRMIQKDLMSECRAWHAWPAMLLLGTAVVLTFALQIDLPPSQRQRVIGGLLWMAIFFAGTVSIERSLSLEQEDSCLEGLLLYPISPVAIFLAKWAVNLVALVCLEIVLVPMFIVLSEAPLLKCPWALLLSLALGNCGLAAVGTLLSAATSGLRNRSSLLALLVLPLVLPVVLGAAEATRLMLAGTLDDQWWRWIQLLGAFAVVFVTAGAMLFEFVVEE